MPHQPPPPPPPLFLPCCSGRFLRPSFDGYRLLVTKAGGQQCWVNLDNEGAPTFLHDYASGGGQGAIHSAKRESQDLNHPAMVRGRGAATRARVCTHAGIGVRRRCVPGVWLAGGRPLLRMLHPGPTSHVQPLTSRVPLPAPPVPLYFCAVRQQPGV